MILVCGSVTDIVTELVCARLEHQRAPHRLLELARYPEQYKVGWVWDRDRADGVIEGPGWRVDLASISGVFVRYLDRVSRRSPLSDGWRDAAACESQAGLMALWEHMPCPVANRISGGLSNHSKPYQLLAIRQTVLRIPQTLVTSDPSVARAFYDEHKGRVIFKSLSGARSIVRLMEPADLDRLPLLRDGAAQFQEYVPGIDVRVHTVGTEVLATRIRSAGVDYRYAEQQGAEVEMEPTELPARVTDACLELARAMDLLIAGIDLKLTPAGEWYCFEVNPCPGFASYELRTGQPISAALVAALGGGRHRGEGCYEPRRQGTVETEP